MGGGVGGGWGREGGAMEGGGNEGRSKVRLWEFTYTRLKEVGTGGCGKKRKEAVRSWRGTSPEHEKESGKKMD